MNGYLIALIVFVAWIGLVYILKTTKWLDRHSMGLFGPMIMWRTRKGRDLIERLASWKRLWTIYGKLALWICAGAMVLIMTLLLWEATIVSQVESAPSPELILGIPGINPVIPLGYGILGLAIAIVVHEFSHGIMTRLGGMKIESLGLVFLVFPMGAFVEPNEEELKATTRSKRAKVFAAGPASNMILAMLMLSLFSGVMMSSVEPTQEGALALGVVQDSPADMAGLLPSCVITSIGGVDVTGPDGVEARSAANPGENVTVTYYYQGDTLSATFVDGVVVAYVAEGYAAHNAGIAVGMVMVSLDGYALGNTDAISAVMSGLSPGDTVPVSVMSYDSDSGQFVVDASITEVTLSNKWDYYAEYSPGENDPSYDGVAYLAGGFLNLGVRAEDPGYYADILANPFSGDNDLSDFSRSWLRLIALPFLDLAPLRSPVTDLYEPSGSMAWMPDSAFWLLTNSLYWIFWLNLMIGLTNVLPAVPLDGGYIFRDALDYLLDKTGRKYTKEQKEKIVGSITLALALLVLFLIMWQLVGPTVL